MEKLLITGGAGFIGSNFVRFILSLNDNLEIYNLDNLTYAGSLDNLVGLPNTDRSNFIKGNICDESLIVELLRKYRIDTIVHFAAETHVDRSIIDPKPFIETNLIGSFSLLEAARTVWEESGGFIGKRFHHISTDEVYGSLEADDSPFLETTPYDPRSPYSATKAGSDHLVRSYYHTYGLPVTISNCSNNYGPYQYPEKMIPLMILNGLQGKHLPIYGDGNQIRDWLFVLDHCDAILKILRDGQPGQAYNIGGGNQPTNLEIVRLICDLLDEMVPESYEHHSLIKHVPDRPGHDRRYAVEFSKISNRLGWVPHNNLEMGLRLTIKWYLDNLEWVKKIVVKSGRTDRIELDMEKTPTNSTLGKRK